MNPPDKNGLTRKGMCKWEGDGSAVTCEQCVKAGCSFTGSSCLDDCSKIADVACSKDCKAFAATEEKKTACTAAGTSCKTCLEGGVKGCQWLEQSKTCMYPTGPWRPGVSKCPATLPVVPPKCPTAAEICSGKTKCPSGCACPKCAVVPQEQARALVWR